MIEAGKVLADKQANTNREIGEWFNTVKGSRGGDRKAKNQTPDSGACFSTKEIWDRAPPMNCRLPKFGEPSTSRSPPWVFGLLVQNFCTPPKSSTSPGLLKS